MRGPRITTFVNHLSRPRRNDSHAAAAPPTAIRSQPVESINGRFRLTEQGEIIASRYFNPTLAHRHLEQIVNAILLASSPKATSNVSQRWRIAMDQMSAKAQHAYRSLGL